MKQKNYAKKDTKPAWLITILSVLVLALVISGCSKSAEGVVKTSQVNDNEAEEADGTNQADQPVKEFIIDSFTEVIDGKYYPQFSKKEITVNKGDLVRIKVNNLKGTHDFKIDEFNVYTETPLDQEMAVEFVADQAGSFEYYCTKNGHRQNGQWGTLKVLE